MTNLTTKSRVTTRTAVGHTLLHCGQGCCLSSAFADVVDYPQKLLCPRVDNQLLVSIRRLSKRAMSQTQNIPLAKCASEWPCCRSPVVCAPARLLSKNTAGGCCIMPFIISWCDDYFNEAILKSFRQRRHRLRTCGQLRGSVAPRSI